MTKEAFFNQFYHSAVQCERQTEIPALATLAQAAMESGWGEKIPGNMFFGIKAGPSWTGRKQLLTTREVLSKKDAKFPEIISITARTDGKYDYRVKDWFRAYDRAAESFIDHGQFIMSQPRYKAAIGVHDPLKFADIVSKAGYATDPNYAKTWKQIIGSLSQFIPTGNNSN
jgi:flagellum-specific peptidoglycan hydrolase FlgJ